MTGEREKEIEEIAKEIHRSYAPDDKDMSFKDTDWFLAKRLTWENKEEHEETLVDRVHRECEREDSFMDRFHQEYSEYINVTQTYPNCVFLPAGSSDLILDFTVKNPFYNKTRNSVVNGVVTEILGMKVKFWNGDHILFGTVDLKDKE